MIERIRNLMPDALFAEPATAAMIAAAEEQLGVTLPAPLRELYLAFDGFREPLGNAAYLLPLFDDRGVGSLVSNTLFHWNEWPRSYPTLDLRPFVLFGMSGSDEYWGMRHAGPSTLILYGRLMEEAYEDVAGTIADAYAADQADYDDA